MYLRTPNGSLSLELLDAIRPQGSSEPDLQVQIDATVGPFKAAGVGAWLEWPDVQVFVRELEALAQSCNGSATCGAMSPTDLTLSVFSVDSLGHFAIKFNIGSVVHSREGIFPCALSGGFEL